MIRRPPRSTQSRSSAASDVYKRQDLCENDLMNQNDTEFCKSISESSLQRGIFQGYNKFLSNAKENADFLLKYNGTRLDTTRANSLLDMSSMAFYIGMAIRETLVRMIDNISDRISEIQWNVISVASAVYILFAIIGTIWWIKISRILTKRSQMPFKLLVLMPHRAVEGNAYIHTLLKHFEHFRR
eukprot:TRINITY_DN6087_c0_g3_i1.p1 TRINITY_DN6087_c0_g3~~TRINITY_DN6087_c0_g3_i1.p1  ORF type:complete len:185 (+),score=33.05 TRINITY_DN6087_c0_g3_i1:33-587(+)